MVDLQSAEGVTKYLRSRNTSIDDIVKVSHSLLDGGINVYLPNKVPFVLELIVDRLGDHKLKGFRSDYRVWDLFNKTWLLLDSDPKLRTRSIQNFKFGEAVSVTLSSATPESYGEVFRVVTKAINLVRLNSSINNLHDFATPILTHYLTILHQLGLSSEESKQSISDISAFFKSSAIVEKQTKTFVLNFVTQALPIVLETIEKNQSSYDLFNLVKRIVFPKEQLFPLSETIDTLLKTNASSIAITGFFKLAIDTVTKADLQTSEMMFTKITTKYPEVSEELFSYISNTKRTLSEEFLSRVFENEFAKPIQNWKLMRSILQLNIEISLKNCERILTNLDQQQSPIFISVTEEIVESYIRARDLSNFFKIWDTLLNKGNKIVASPEFSSLLSTKISYFSISQLKLLIEDILHNESDSRFKILNSVVYGIFSLKDPHIFEQSKVLLQPVFELQSSDENLWKLKYQLVSLYEDILPVDGLKSIVSNSKLKKASTYQYFTYFRIREIVEYDIEGITESFVKFVKRNDDVLEVVFSRWFVLVNTFFKIEQIDSLVQALLKNYELTLKILENYEIFEQTSIVDSIIDNTLKSLQNSKKVDKKKIDLFASIPIQCYAKRFRAPIIDSLTEILLSSNKGDNNDMLKTIIHILETPTFKTKVETDLKTIISILSRYPSSTIFETVWNHHVKNIKVDTSLSFIKDSIKTIQKSLKSKSLTEITPEFYLAFTILSEPPALEDDESIQKLQSYFISASKRLLNASFEVENLDYTNISWLLNVLFELELNLEDFESLHQSLKSFGKKLTQLENEQTTKLNLFRLLSKYFKFSNTSPQYFEALYIVLKDQGCNEEKLLDGLQLIFKGLNDEKFNSSFSYTLNSLDSSSSCPGSILEIITAYWKSMTRSNPQSVQLFIKSLSMISLRLNENLNSDPSMVVVLNGIKNIIVEKTWVITQYGIEIILSILSKMTDSLSTSRSAIKEDLFISITLTVSNILLFHRYRLSNRHHVVLSVFNSLLQTLTNKVVGNSLSRSTKGAQAFSRLLANLCEPQTTKETSKDSLNSSISLLKRSLRKHLPSLLLSYIYFALKFSFNSEVNELILPGIFNIFDVLSKDELILVSTSLDNSGRSYYRSLYEDYKKIGKWQTS